MIAAIVNHLWQSTLFAVLAVLLVHALRDHAARVRYWVWFAASVKFLVPFSLFTWFGSELSWRAAAPSAPAAPQTIMTTLQGVAAPLENTTVAVASTLAAWTFDWIKLVLAIWLVGCALFAGRWLFNWLKVARDVRAATRVDLALPVATRMSTQLREPVAVGVFRPVLMLPDGIAERLSPEQMRAILAHELTHVRNRDNLTAAIHMIVEVAFWFHPLVWWIGARLVEERERACDEAVVALGNEPRRYVEGILEVCRYYVESKVPCVAGVSGANLKHRVEAIMSNKTILKLSSARKALLASVGAMAVIAPFAVGLATGTSNAPVAFDIVTIKRAAGTEAKGAKMMVMSLGGNLRVENVPLRAVIAQAYGVQRANVIGGPAWLDKPLYDIEARTNADLDPVRDGEAFRRMTQNLLAKEFGLIAHTETQQPRTLVLRVDQGGSKLQPVTDTGSGNRGMMLEREGVKGSKAPIKVLVDFLSLRLKQPVVDQTGLTGSYDFELKSKFSADALPVDLKEQLGLTLEPQAVPMDVVVVDAATEPNLPAQSPPLASTTQL